MAPASTISQCNGEGAEAASIRSFFGKTIGVGVVERRAEPIENETRFRDRSRNDWIELPESFISLFKHRSVRTIALVNDAQQRQAHREQNALLHANKNHNRRSCDRQHVFAGALAADGA